MVLSGKARSLFPQLWVFVFHHLAHILCYAFLLTVLSCNQKLIFFCFVEGILKLKALAVCFHRFAHIFCYALLPNCSILWLKLFLFNSWYIYKFNNCSNLNMITYTIATMNFIQLLLESEFTILNYDKNNTWRQFVCIYIFPCSSFWWYCLL